MKHCAKKIVSITLVSIICFVSCFLAEAVFDMYEGSYFISVSLAPLAISFSIKGWMAKYYGEPLSIYYLA